MNDFILLGNRILIKFEEEAQKTVGGIILSPGVQDRFPRALVKHVSLDVPLMNEGDEIVVDRHSGLKISIGEETYQLIKGEDVIAVFQVK